ncbi:MAG TPA: EscU/YscU/HrcU family type III secretion system export apparatus switch protein [Myxococcales bacterium]|nr:EscU/YscU/HrcU family type III secretion system export apparatus switch protein [Myxococcales bacterium]
MADEERDQRTEPASERRLQKAREEGQIPFGRDIVGVASMAFAAVAIWQLALPLRNALVSMVQERLSGVAHASLTSAVSVGYRVPLFALLICCAAAAGATIAGVAQTQGGFWPELAMPDVSRMVGGRLKKLFQPGMLVDLLFSAVKVAAILGVLWLSWRGKFESLFSLVNGSPAALLSGGASWLSTGLVRAVGVLVALGAGDLLLQRKRYADKMKMTKAEAKRDAKEDAGDPLIRGRRRRRHRELARGRAAVEVPRADALVVNPTHIAIAIRYRKSDGKAPRVTAKGKGVLAEMMRDLARTNGVPIVEDITLARLLWKRVKVGREVPAETYKAVAAILAFVYRLTRRSFA